MGKTNQKLLAGAILVFIGLVGYVVFGLGVNSNQDSNTNIPQPILQSQPEPKPEPEPVNTAAPSGSVTYEGQTGKTVLELLKQNADVETEHASWGEFVKSINGQNGSSDKFWIYYVNGEPAQVGADQYQTKDGDLVEWKLEIGQ